MSATKNSSINRLGDYFPLHLLEKAQSVSSRTAKIDFLPVPGEATEDYLELGIPNEINIPRDAETVTAEISRCLNVSLDDARGFIDRSAFDEILDVLKQNDCGCARMNRAYLAMIFCQITLRNV